jgi:hypothetical protein
MDVVLRPPVRCIFYTFEPLSFVEFPDYTRDLPMHTYFFIEVG